MPGLTSLPPRARRFYEAMRAAYGDELDTSDGSHLEAVLFATARALGVAQKMLDRGGNVLASKMYEQLEDREAELGIIPGPNDTVVGRADELRQRLALPTGVSEVALRNALAELLGADYVGLLITTAAAAVWYPTGITGKELNLRAPEIPRKLVQLTGAVSFVGVPVSVTYDLLRGDSRGTALLAGDMLAVDCGALGLEETVEVESTADGSFTATFQLAHSAGAVCTTAPYPSWRTSKRHTMVGLTAEAASNGETRRRTNEHLARRMRAVSTWDVTDGDGPFKVGTGLIGITPIGDVEIS